MRILVLVRSAVVGLLSRKGQTALTCLSLLLGILSVVAVQVIAHVAEQVYVRSAELGRGRDGSVVLTLPATRANREMARHVVDALPGTAAILRDTQAYVVAADGTPINVMGFGGDLTDIYPYGVEHQIRPGEIVMNRAAAGILSGPEPGNYFDPGDVVPVPIKPRTTIDEGNAGAIVIVPESFIGDLPAGSQLQIFHYLPDTSSAALQEQLTNTAAHVGLQGPAPETVDVRTEIRMQLQVLQQAFLIAAAITLVVGVVAVMNVSLAALPGRTEELALRRSLGASRLDVFVLVLVEGGLIGAFAALAAISLFTGIYLGWIRHAVPGMLVGYPLSAVLAAMTTGVAAGLIAHVIPAIRASRIVIATVMRA